MTVSMSRKGDCWNNAPMESFWGTLKNELVHHRRYRTRAQAVQEITSTSRYFITGSGNRHASATCHPPLSRSVSMQNNSRLNPLDSTIANRPQFERSCRDKE